MGEQRFYPTNWATVTEDEDLETRRLQVPGGFLVLTRETKAGRDQNMVQTFVPVSDGIWELEGAT